MKNDMAEFNNIKVRTEFEVKDILSDAGKFILVSAGGDKEIADYVVNCTWQNIEFLNNKLGLDNSLQGKMTSRLKLLVEVELPPSLVQKHSMFFVLGRMPCFQI